MASINGDNIRSCASTTYDSRTQTAEDRSRHFDVPRKSPLQVFVRAKKKLNEISAEIEQYAIEATQFIFALHPEAEIVDKTEREHFETYVHKGMAIREALSRDHMKVIFLGRTSNGKSSVINAMLREKILPSGIGHTTSCFCQVEGCNGPEAYLMKDDSSEKFNAADIKKLANALYPEQLGENSLVRIFWPRERCSVLRDDVVFVDSPGLDVSPNQEDWIDKHCLNADVFVLVLNAESTMGRAEKQFFQRISQRLSTPNIFILNNRWDVSASEPEFQELVKSQHSERCIHFLTNELKKCDEREANERVFFVSARETLHARLEEAKGNHPHWGACAEGFQIRYFEFQDFERKFEKCISKSAVKTKLEMHSSDGKAVIGDMRSMLDNIYERSSIFHKLKLDQRTLLNDWLKIIKTQMLNIPREMKLKTLIIVEEVERKVAKALTEEIWRLGVLVDEFKMPFHTDPMMLSIYKKELNRHIEAGLGSNLCDRLSMALSSTVELARNEMTARMCALVPNESLANKSIIVTRTQPFKMLYSMHLQDLCADFQEDLHFRFSWGIRTMIQRFECKAKERKRSVALSSHHADVAPVSSPTLTSMGVYSTVGGMLLAGTVLKCWRVLGIVGALYGYIYFYEWLSWTKSAKERAFKSQYLRHATKKLNMMVALTSASCSHQVHQELSGTYEQLCRLVRDATADMNAEVKTLDQQLSVLVANQKQLKLLRNKAIYIQNELEIFEGSFTVKNKMKNANQANSCVKLPTC